MMKLKKMLYGACAVIASMAVTPLMANELGGLYFGIQGSVNGVEVDGKHTAAADDVADVTTGAIGKVAVIGGAEAGWAIPLGDMFLLDVGVNYVVGSAKMATTSDDTAAIADVSFEVSDLVTFYVAPTVNIGDSSSLYVKFGTTSADAKTTGDVTQPADLDGTTIAIGTRTLMGQGLFIRTEAGITEYDSVSVTGKGEGSEAIATTTTVTADPTVAFGSITIGVQF